ncbi:winged helix-turn-helix domain-containing protein [Nonomuraea angiospora]|uniref:ArsR/SmtB family transcription factor n=1 Tax=Nonomuraea angiospora TaxID=46172 RepID=UPI003411525E
MRDTSIQQVYETRVLKALTHSVRRRILDILKVEGPMTVGQLAEATDQAVGSISHHMRVLAEAGMIEESPTLARDKRERWWTLTSDDVRWSHSDFADDEHAVTIFEAVGSLLLDRQMGLVRDWPRMRDQYAPEWRTGCSVSTETWLQLTPDEARALAAELVALLERWSAKSGADDEQDRQPVFVFAHSVPAKP